MVDSTDIQNLIDYYVNLLIIQYNDKVKARETIALLVDELLASGIYFDVRDGYSVEEAIGAQLDVIGEYVGVDRFYQGVDFDGIYFGFSNANEDEEVGVEGFSDASDFLNKDGIFLGASDVISVDKKLNDDDYRILIKLGIIQNTSNYSDKEINDNLFNFFGNSLYAVDNYNMTMTYFVPSNLTQLIKAIIYKQLLPKPMGVGIQAIIEDNTYFGFTDASGGVYDSVEGFSSASDFLTKEGEFLGVDNIIE